MGRALTTTVYFSSLAIIGLIYGVSAPTLGALAAQTGVGLGTIGVILSARSLGYLLGASQLGRFVDRSGSHRFLALTILVGAGLLALVPFARQLWGLVLLMILSGVTLAGPDVGGNSLVMRLHRQNPGPFMNGLHLFFGLGALFAPILVALTRTESSVAVSYWVLAGIVGAIGLLFLLRPEPPLLPQRKEAEDSGIRSMLWIGCVVFALYVGAEVGFSSWIYEYVRAASDQALATQVTSGFWFAFTGFRLIGVLMAVRFSPARIVIGSLIAGTLACLFLLVMPGTHLVLWLGSLALGAGIAAVYPTFLVFLGQQMTLTGKRIGVIAIASTVGSMTIPWTVGRSFANWGSFAVPLIPGVCLVFSLALFLVLTRRTMHRSLKSTGGIS